MPGRLRAGRPPRRCGGSITFANRRRFTFHLGLASSPWGISVPSSSDRTEGEEAMPRFMSVHTLSPGRHAPRADRSDGPGPPGTTRSSSLTAASAASARQGRLHPRGARQVIHRGLAAQDGHADRLRHPARAGRRSRHHPGKLRIRPGSPGGPREPTPLQRFWPWPLGPRSTRSQTRCDLHAVTRQPEHLARSCDPGWNGWSRGSR
jgi:hypothetical protein